MAPKASFCPIFSERFFVAALRVVQGEFTFGENPAGDDVIDADAMLGECAGESSGEREKATFGGSRRRRD